jgi:hypothetical protein
MDSLEKLQKLRADGDLAITYIDHLPRTISHALKRCLFEVFDGQVNEPFFRKDFGGSESAFPGFDASAGIILQEYEYRRTEKEARGDKSTVTLLIKDVTKSLPPSRFQDWLGAVQNVISLIRDPHEQMYSLMEAIVADSLQKPRFGEPPKIKPTPTRNQVLREWGDKAAEALRMVGGEEINTTSWKPMGGHIAVLDRHVAENPEKKHIVLDGNFLRLRPEEALREIVGYIEYVSFKPEMLNNWGKSEGGFPNERDWGRSAVVINGATRNVWTEKAFGGSGFSLPNNQTTPAVEFPAVLRKHILVDALPIYADALCHPRRIGPKTLEEMESLIETPVSRNGERFVDINPTSAYTFIATLGSAPENAGLLDSLKNIRKQSSAHEEAFDRIDTIMAQLDKPSGNLRLTEEPALVAERNVIRTQEGKSV